MRIQKYKTRKPSLVAKKPHCFQIDKQVKGEANLQKINNN